MRFIEIPKAHFDVEVQDSIPETHYRMLDPYRQRYFKWGHVYLALFFNSENSLVVEYAINTGKKAAGDWVSAIIAVAKENKNKSILFQTAANNKAVHDIAARIGAKKIKEVQDYHGSGESYTFYEFIII